MKTSGLSESIITIPAFRTLTLPGFMKGISGSPAHKDAKTINKSSKYRINVIRIL
jgi:hypothetical protein